MRIEKDYEELLRLLNKYKVRYCIVGAYAVGFYAMPRYTKDIDIFIENTGENARRILKALNEFGFSSLDLKETDFTKKGSIIQLGYEPLRIDILTTIGGCSFSRVWKNKKRGSYGSERVNFIGLNELIQNKRRTGRNIDRYDLEGLMKVKKIKS